MPDSDSMTSFPRARSSEPVVKEDPFATHVDTGETSLFMRLWLATPDWVFRTLGVTFFVLWLSTQIHFYTDWYQLYLVYRKPVMFLQPIKLVLVHSTLLIVMLSFIFRLPAKSRASRPREIILPVIGGFWPFVPFLIQMVLDWKWPAAAKAYNAFTWVNSPSIQVFVTGSVLILLGNALDVWGYASLFRSISIVAEARELKVTGPYLLVRHPIYLGHFIAQAGMWLFFAKTHWVWITFYLFFVFVQLYRSRVEEEVLERAFGERYLQYKRETFWFF